VRKIPVAVVAPFSQPRKNQRAPLQVRKARVFRLRGFRKFLIPARLTVSAALLFPCRQIPAGANVRRTVEQVRILREPVRTL
jgi:hypothetical protein